MNSVVYWLNQADEIVDVNDEWDNFALDNDGNEVVRDKVIGKPLFNFIVGESTRMFVDNLLRRARLRYQETHKFYRCDSPDVKRFMEMRIVPEDRDLLRLEHTIIRREVMTPPVYYQYSPTIKHPYRRCSICNKVLHQSVWCEGSDLIRALPQSSVDAIDAIDVIYHVCPTCIYQLI
ncbi:MAG: hypothetical protein KDJ65_10860 [Anaerolineae bacterium]|nr:hypothetical protein [Anaerolineae bacterium]